jgi:hypothetical protein
MPDPFDSLFPPADAEGAAAWYREHVAGSYASNWGFLRDAAASSFFHAAQALWGVIEAAERGSSNGQPRGETCSVLSLNWKLFASGPLLAATLTPAFAIEAFVRHFAEVGIRAETSRCVSFCL